MPIPWILGKPWLIKLLSSPLGTTQYVQTQHKLTLSYCNKLDGISWPYHDHNACRRERERERECVHVRLCKSEREREESRERERMREGDDPLKTKPWWVLGGLGLRQPIGTAERWVDVVSVDQSAPGYEVGARTASPSSSSMSPWTVIDVSLKVQFIFKYFYMTFIMDSSISYEKSSNSLHSFLQQHHQHVQQQQQQLRLSVQQHHHQQQQQQQQHHHQQQQLVDNSDKLHSDHSDQENQHQTDSCLFQNDSQPFVACTNPHGIDTILNRRGLVSVAGGSSGNSCSVADTLAAAAACSLQQSAISRFESRN